jgi:hypothetical protein
MTGKIVRLAAVMIAFAALANADSILFGLAGDPGQNYTFTPAGAAPGVTDTEPAGPYPGWLGEDVTADDNYFFCVTFTKTANWGASYAGTLTTPTTQTELEAAYLGSVLVGLGDQNATLAEKGEISMAIWQITEPGSVPIDPNAQTYVSQAENEYSSGALTSAEFANSKIFVPDNTGIQSFMIAAAETPTPEPGSIGLILTGVALIAISRLRRKRP